VAATELVDVRRLDRPVVDVRQDNEHAAGHIPDSVHVELGDISEQDAELPDGELAVMCGHGERAATAASVLEQAGRRDIAVVIGGPDDWQAATGETLETG
jgi:rhodanese-related sulfurtransferase